mgnify:CR=1 FL=1
MMEYYQKEGEDVLKDLKSSAKGLSSKLAKTRLKKHGKKLTDSKTKKHL